MQNQTIPFQSELSPIALFSAIREKFGIPTVLLESIKTDDNNTMSIIAANPIQEILSTKNSLQKLKQAIQKSHKINSVDFPFTGGLIGYFNFEIFYEIEPKLSPEFFAKNNIPNTLFYEFSRYIFINHQTQKIIFVETVSNENFLLENKEIINQAIKFIPTKFNSKELEKDNYANFTNFEFEQDFSIFQKKVQLAQEKIRTGEIFQIIVSNEFSKNISGHDGLEFYEILRIIEPSTHLFFFDFGHKYGQILGATPEILGSKRGQIVSYSPIAGTRFRGNTEEKDKEIFVKMKNNEKENAEHDMLVDLGRNDLGKICEPGSVHLKKEKYGKFCANLMHLVSDLEGIIRPELDAVDFFESIHPAGTLVGAPKIRAVEILQDLENCVRNLYGGAVGYFSTDNNMQFVIAIRSFLIRNDVVRFRTGGGIVQDSIDKDEWLEVHNKAKSLVKVINYICDKKISSY